MAGRQTANYSLTLCRARAGTGRGFATSAFTPRRYCRLPGHRLAFLLLLLHLSGGRRAFVYSPPQSASRVLAVLAAICTPSATLVGWPVDGGEREKKTLTSPTSKVPGK